VLYHVRKVSLGLKRKYRVLADDGTGRPGSLLGYAEKRLKVADELVLYRDRQREEVLATVRESSRGWLAALTGYEVLGAEGRLLGGFGVRWRDSWQRTTWQLDQPGFGRLVGSERSLGAARLRRLVSLGGVAGEIGAALVKYHFDFAPEDGGEAVLSIEKPKMLDDWYRILVEDDRLDPVLLFALTVTMEARQH